MARRLRRSRYRRRQGYSRRRYRRRRIYGKRRAASQQKQRANFLVKSTYTGYIQIDPYVSVFSDTNTSLHANKSNVGGSAVLSVYRNLLKSNYFQSIRAMYDQVRVNSCKITIMPTSSVLSNSVKQGLFVSAWDRNGTDDPQHPPSISEITSHSSAFQKPLNLEATSWKATRKIVASTIAEKSTFIPTGMLSGSGNDLVAPSGFLTSLGQHVTMQWNPQLLIGVMLGVDSAQVPYTPQAWGFVAQFEWSLTFRGVRYDVQNSDGAVQQVQAIVNPVAAPSVGVTIIPPSSTYTPSVTRTLGTTVTDPTSLLSINRIYDDFIFTNIDVSTPYFLNSPDHWTTVDGESYTFNTSVLATGYKIVLLFADYGGDALYKKRTIGIIRGYFEQIVDAVTVNIPGADDIHYQIIFSSSVIVQNPLSYSYAIQSIPPGSPYDASNVNYPLDTQTAPAVFLFGPLSVSTGAGVPYPPSQVEEL